MTTRNRTAAAAIQLVRLTKRFGRTTAIDQLVI